MSSTNQNPTDQPLFADQWYLENTGQNGGTPGADIDVVPAWDAGLTGAGVTVVVDDTGIDYTNPNIAPNYDAATSQSLDAPTDNGYPYNDIGLPPSETMDLAHGTWVTGLIAAADNGTGIVGVAYQATVSAFRVIDTAANTDTSDPFPTLAEALSNTASFDVANNSWGFTSALVDSVFNPDTQVATEALLTAAEDGRGGLGTINVFAAGNYYAEGDDTNLHAFQSSINVVTVAALDDNGTVNAPASVGGRYSTPGATILVSAPGTGITSDTIVGEGDLDNGDVEDGLDGTSFATPLVTGIIALMLQANPKLGLRDVQEILAYTAKQTDPTDPTWSFNDATNWNGGGLHVSDDYGFGLVDATAAVELAKSWTLQQTANNRTIDTVSANGVGAITSSGTSYSFTVTSADTLSLQWVRVQLSFEFSAFDNLVVTLTSPGGAQSVLLDQPNDGEGGFIDNTVQLSTNQFWGQGSVGTWTLTMRDANAALGSTGEVTSASLVLVGDPPPANATFIYTNEYMADAAADTARETLNDPTGGFVTLNLAAVSANCTIDMEPGSAGTIGGTPFTIGSTTTVTVVYTGLGTNTIEVNGDSDIITSEGGNDTVVFSEAEADYALARSAGQVTVAQGDVTDYLNSVETLDFAGHSVAADSIPCFVAGTLVLTARGEVPVEALRIGDRVPTLSDGQLARIAWLGHSRSRAWPVRIDSGAFGEGIPHHALLLSPDHAAYAEGALTPVRCLVNGASIVPVRLDSADYWHVELDRHAAIVAEGLACESYLDTGNRQLLAPRSLPGDRAAARHSG